MALSAGSMNRNSHGRFTDTTRSKTQTNNATVAFLSKTVWLVRVLSQASFWSGRLDREFPRPHSPLKALHLQITLICINFGQVHEKKRVNVKSRLSIRSHVGFPHYSTDMMKFGTPYE
jgi:hypothetical protein